MSDNLQAILFKHGEKKWNKIILVSKYCSEHNLHTILLIHFDIFKHEEKEWNL